MSQTSGFPLSTASPGIHDEEAMLLKRTARVRRNLNLGMIKVDVQKIP